MKTIRLILWCLLVLSGCSKAGEGERFPVTLTLTAEGTATRSGGRTDYAFERTVGRVDVFVYNSDGSFDSRMTVDGETTLVLRCTSGLKTIRVYVNAPSASAFYDNETLQGGVAAKAPEYLDWNDPGENRFLMRGSASFSVSDSGDNEFSVTVSRSLARVDLKSIDWEYPEGHTASFLGAYLSNANRYSPGDDWTGLSWKGSMWYNKCGRASYADGLSAGNNLLIDFVNRFPEQELTCYQPSSPVSMVSGTLWTAPEVTSSMEAAGERGAQMYAMRNNDGASLWNPGTYAWNDGNGAGTLIYEGITSLRTRLVCVFRIDGVLWYYPVSFPSFRRNVSYEVSLTIRSTGSDDPEKELSPADLYPVITLKEWETGAGHSERL